MATYLKPLQDQVIVVSSTTTSLGQQVANLAIDIGARVVVVAPNEEMLQQISSGMKGKGMAVYVHADAKNEDDVNRIARTATRTFGGIDTWINITGTPLSGSSLGISVADLKILTDNSFWAIVLGSRTAAMHFLNEKQAGVIINVHNIFPDPSTVNLPMYFASRQAVRGWTDGFRMELEKMTDLISVSLIQPGRAGLLRSPAHNYDKHPGDAEVARAILFCATHFKKEIYIGSESKLSSLLHDFSPMLTRMMEPGAEPGPVTVPDAGNNRPGNEFVRRPDATNTPVGGFATKYPLISTIVFAGIGAGLWMFSRKKKPD
jgi:NADP-dependent 3-hydroxy acid dehydrogenase YdfG